MPLFVTGQERKKQIAAAIHNHLRHPEALNRPSLGADVEMLRYIIKRRSDDGSIPGGITRIVDEFYAERKQVAELILNQFLVNRKDLHEGFGEQKKEWCAAIYREVMGPVYANAGEAIDEYFAKRK